MLLLYVQLLRRKNKYGLVWVIVINPPELQWTTNLETKDILQAQVCDCTSTKKRNGKLAIYHEISKIKQIVTGQFWKLAQKIN